VDKSVICSENKAKRLPFRQAGSVQKYSNKGKTRATAKVTGPNKNKRPSGKASAQMKFLCAPLVCKVKVADGFDALSGIQMSSVNALNPGPPFPALTTSNKLTTLIEHG